MIVTILKQKDYVEYIQPVDTNIIIFKLKDEFSADEFILSMREKGIWLVGMGPQLIRIVTHLGIGEKEMVYLLTTL